ncbi:MAG: LURP-one-related family protein [Spirochaetales bacterium]|nr:LURP-one-related family protein [Spirochaetales bacterium]MBQ9811294.1 LURP-one-related family protein [Spirochaetales bacterium]
MGVFSKYHRFREAGEDANVNNVERFGEPKRSLFTTTKVFTLHHHIDITDAAENVVYKSESKVFSIHDKTHITDMNGNEVAYIWRKVFTLHERHFIEMADGTSFQLSNEIWHLVKDITNIEGLGWQLRGNFVGLNFELYDENDEIIAVICQKIISLHDKYCIDLYKPEHEKTCVAILIALQHMMKDREASAAAAGSGTGAAIGASSSSSK